MADMRDLWWSAGQMASSVAEKDTWRHYRWSDSLRRSATLLEPVWPKHYSSGPFTYALPTVALLLYAGPPGSEPEHVPVEDIVTALAPRRTNREAPSLEDSLRANLAKRHHDLSDDSKLSALVRTLTVYHPRVTHTSTGDELPSLEQSPGGSLLDAGAEWAYYAFAHHYLGRAA